MEKGNWNEIEPKLVSKINEIFKDKDISKLSKYEIRKTIFEYLCDTLKYDYELLERVQNNTNRELYKEFESVMDNNIGICNAISQYYILLLEEVGIKSKYVLCDDGLVGGHALTLVYDEEHDVYSLDDITSVIVGRGDKNRFFDYSLSMGNIYGQGNKEIIQDKKWLIISNGYIYDMVGKEDINYDYEDLPSNIKSVRLTERKTL